MEPARPVYLVGSDQRLHSQVILHQLLHVGLRPHEGGELGSDETGGCRQRRLVGDTGGRAGVSVPEKHIPRLGGGGGWETNVILGASDTNCSGEGLMTEAQLEPMGQV